MNGKYGIATPTTEAERAKLKSRIGRDHFFFKADPTDAVNQSEQGDIPCLRWEFNQLDPMMRICMTVEASRIGEMSIKEADAYLTRTGAFFIKSQIELTYTDADPDDWASAYPIYQRKGSTS